MEKNILRCSLKFLLSLNSLICWLLNYFITYWASWYWRYTISSLFQHDASFIFASLSCGVAFWWRDPENHWTCFISEAKMIAVHQPLQCISINKCVKDNDNAMITINSHAFIISQTPGVNLSCFLHILRVFLDSLIVFFNQFSCVISKPADNEKIFSICSKSIPL